MPFRKPFLIALTLLTGGFASAQRYSPGDIVENFTLTNRATGQAVELYDLEGKVLFLEWFAWWCPFCQAAAAQVETGIVDYYKNSRGNTHGVPVMHVGLNMQGNAESQTQAFVNSYGIEYVLNDFDRAISSKFQTGGQPIFAIINGVKNSASHDQWELIYSRLGYGDRTHPIATFRSHIDSVEAAAVEVPVVTITGGNAITEGGSASFTLTATPAPGASLDVSVSVADDTDSDFVAPANEGARTVAIPTGGTVSFTVATVDDEVDEADGSVSATVNSGSGYTVDSPSSASVAVSDNDEPPPPPLPSEYINYLSNLGIPEDQLQQDLDPDFDGVPNVFEYYFGSDASDTSSFAQPTSTILTIASTRYHALQFIRDPTAVGVEISVEFSDSPSFDTLNESVQLTPELLENGMELVVVRSASPLSTREFSRLIYRSEDL